MLLIHGTGEKPIGYDEMYLPCRSCEVHTEQQILVKTSYFHLYWMPFWPMGKTADIICTQCGLKRYGMPIDADLISEVKAFNRKFRNPWYVYTGPFLLVLITAFIVISLVSAAFS